MWVLTWRHFSVVMSSCSVTTLGIGLIGTKSTPSMRQRCQRCTSTPCSSPSPMTSQTTPLTNDQAGNRHEFGSHLQPARTEDQRYGTMPREPSALHGAVRGSGSASTSGLPTGTSHCRAAARELLHEGVPGRRRPRRHSPPAGGRAQVQQRPGLLQELEAAVELQQLEGGAGAEACGAQSRAQGLRGAAGRRREPAARGPSPVSLARW